MKDKDGNTLKAGDRFIYQVGEPHERAGELFSLCGIEVIKWEDDNEIISVSDFYHQPTDQKILQRI